ncbi:MAG: hypothetical protein K6U11_14535 [bacterium]|nr:hypothetical protein [bacterium]
MANFLGIDVGSVTTKIVLIDAEHNILFDTYLRTEGGPIHAIQRGFKQLYETVGEAVVSGVGTTGSGRRLAGIMAGADIVKNEITAHAVAARWVEPKVGTVIDIGGQDSKIIWMHVRGSLGIILGYFWRLVRQPYVKDLIWRMNWGI